jgi:hypothetical protein
VRVTNIQLDDALTSRLESLGLIKYWTTDVIQDIGQFVRLMDFVGHGGGFLGGSRRGFHNDLHSLREQGFR